MDLAADNPDFSFPPHEDYPPNPDGVDPEYPNDVPVNTLVVWMVTLWVNNPHDYPMTEVVVTDHFGAELGGEGTSSENVTGALDFFIKEHSRGNSKKEPFETQYRITWYVTGDESDNSGVLEPYDAAYMEMLVWTKLNPSGRQEYTSTGLYTLNSGPTDKWYDAPPDEGGHQFSFEGEPVHIYVFEY